MKRARMHPQIDEPWARDFGAPYDRVFLERLHERLGDRARRFAELLVQRQGNVRRKIAVLRPLRSLDDPACRRSNLRSRLRRRAERPLVRQALESVVTVVRTRSARLISHSSASECMGPRTTLRLLPLRVRSLEAARVFRMST